MQSTDDDVSILLSKVGGYWAIGPLLLHNFHFIPPFELVHNFGQFEVRLQFKITIITYGTVKTRHGLQQWAE